MALPDSILTVVAWRVDPDPCQPPPTSTDPPDVCPEASITRLERKTRCSPVATTDPPAVAFVSPLAAICPLRSALPRGPASSMMRPPTWDSVGALNDPVFLMTVSRNALALLAEIRISPPSARTA